MHVLVFTDLLMLNSPVQRRQIDGQRVYSLDWTFNWSMLHMIVHLIQQKGTQWLDQPILADNLNLLMFNRLIVTLVKIPALRYSRRSGLQARIVSILDATKVWSQSV